MTARRERRDKELRDIWARVFELYYEDANQDFQHSVVGLRTPLRICRGLFPIATRALYAHPHLVWCNISKFHSEADRPITACDRLGYASTSAEKDRIRAKECEEVSRVPKDIIVRLPVEADPLEQRRVLQWWNLFVPAISPELMSDPSPRTWLVRKLSAAPTHPAYFNTSLARLGMDPSGYTIHRELLDVLQEVEVDELTLLDVYVKNPQTAQLFLGALEAVNTVHENHLHRSSMRAPNATKQLRFHLELRMWPIKADQLNRIVDDSKTDLTSQSSRLPDLHSKPKDRESSRVLQRISWLRNVPVSKLYSDDLTRQLLLNLGAVWVMEDDTMVPQWPIDQNMSEIYDVLSDIDFSALRESKDHETTPLPTEVQDTSVKIEKDSDWECDTERAFFDPGPEGTSAAAASVPKVDDERSSEETVDETMSKQVVEEKIKVPRTADSTEAQTLWLAALAGAKWITPPGWIEEGSRVKRERTVLSDWVRSYVADQHGKLDWAHHVGKRAHSPAPTPADGVAPKLSPTTRAPGEPPTALDAPHAPPAAIPSPPVGTSTVSTASTSDVDWDEARRESGNLPQVPPPAGSMPTSTWSDLGKSMSSITPTAASTMDNSWSQVGDSLVAGSVPDGFGNHPERNDGSPNALAVAQDTPRPSREAACQAEISPGDLKRKHADDVMERSAKQMAQSGAAASTSFVNHIVYEPTYDPIPSGIREHLERGPSTFTVGAMAINIAVNELAYRGKNTLCSNIETYFHARREMLMKGSTGKHKFASTTGSDVAYVPRTASSPWWTPHEVLVSADHVSGWDAGDEPPPGIPAPLPFTDDPIPPLCWIEDVIPLLPPSVTPLPMFSNDTPVSIAAILSQGLASVIARMSPGHVYLSATDPLAAMAFRLPWHAVPVPEARVRVPAAVRPLDVLAGWGLPVEYGDGHMVRIRPTVLHPETELFTLECTLEQFNDDSFIAQLPIAVSRVWIQDSGVETPRPRSPVEDAFDDGAYDYDYDDDYDDDDDDDDDDDTVSDNEG